MKKMEENLSLIFGQLALKQNSCESPFAAAPPLFEAVPKSLLVTSRPPFFRIFSTATNTTLSISGRTHSRNVIEFRKRTQFLIQLFHSLSVTLLGNFLVFHTLSFQFPSMCLSFCLCHVFFFFYGKFCGFILWLFFLDFRSICLVFSLFGFFLGFFLSPLKERDPPMKAVLVMMDVVNLVDATVILCGLSTICCVACSSRCFTNSSFFV